MIALCSMIISVAAGMFAGATRNLTKSTESKMNIWELLELHIQDNLGYYGLEFLDKFLELKAQAEALGLCPPDTPERQNKFAEQNG